jgi:hypothetical protein
MACFRTPLISAFLLAAQLVSLALYAAFEGVPGRVLLNAFGMRILVLVPGLSSAVPAISDRVILAAPAVVLSLLSWLSVNPTLFIWAALLEARCILRAGGLITYRMGMTG